MSDNARVPERRGVLGHEPQGDRAAHPPVALSAAARRQIMRRWSPDGPILSDHECREKVDQGTKDVAALLLELDRLEVIMLRARSVLGEWEAMRIWANT
jgi:hypothetical protein